MKKRRFFKEGKKVSDVMSSAIRRENGDGRPIPDAYIAQALSFLWTCGYRGQPQFAPTRLMNRTKAELDITCLIRDRVWRLYGNIG